MKIAIFHFGYGEGGARHALYNHLKPLKEQHKFDLFTFTPEVIDKHIPLMDIIENKYVFKIRKAPLRKKTCNIINKIFYLIKFFSYLHRLKKRSRDIALLIDKGNYDLVYADICRYIMAPYVFRFTKIPSIYFCQNPLREARESTEFFKRKPILKKKIFTDKICTWLDDYRKYTLRFIEKKNAKEATKILTNSYYTREYIYHAYGLEADVIHLGVDHKVFYPSNSVHKNYILSVGGFQFIKGFNNIIEGLEFISERQRPRLVLVGNRGDPHFKRQLLKNAQEKKVELEIYENISLENLKALYSEAFAMVFVPYMEPFGLVTLEAMACGTPVIGINEGGLREIIVERETGILVNRNPQEIAKAIMCLKDEKLLRNKIINNALMKIKEYWNWQRAAEQLNEYFNKMRKH